VIDPVLFLAFLPAALALNLTPGPDMLFSLAQGMRSGWPAGLKAAAGISTGVMVHVLLAGLGLGALVAAVPGVFDAIRWAGAGYLVWVAWRTLRTPFGGGDARASARPFRDGLIVNLSNPKVILFVLALVPQFADPARPVLPQFLILGAVLALGALAANGMVGATAGGLGRVLARDRRVERALRWATAGLFGGLAVRLAAMGRA
jgi:threonine/homoserine/homoserine lactone efflux protein